MRSPHHPKQHVLDEFYSAAEAFLVIYVLMLWSEEVMLWCCCSELRWDPESLGGAEVKLSLGGPISWSFPFFLSQGDKGGLGALVCVWQLPAESSALGFK